MTSRATHILSSRCKLARRQRLEGAAALEFALVLPLFILLTLGLVDFGHMLFVVNTITNAAREGARRGVVQQASADIRTQAEAAATTYLNNARVRGATVSCPGLTGNNVVCTVTIPAYRNISGFRYNLPGMPSNTLGGTRPLTSVSTMRWEYAP